MSLRVRLGVAQKKTTMALTESCLYANHSMSSMAPLSFVLLGSGACMCGGDGARLSGEPDTTEHVNYGNVM